jgi:hypothetical protein
VNDLLPYLERMGAAAGVIFFALYLRETVKRDAITKQLIDLLPRCVTAMDGTKTSVDHLTQVLRDGVRRDGRKGS